MNTKTGILLLIVFFVGFPQIIFPQRSRARVVTAEAKPTATPGVGSVGTAIRDDEILRVETDLVTVPVSVTDRDGRYVPHLRREDFRLFENEREQEIAFFNATDKPFTVVLLLDTSHSVSRELPDIKFAAKAFVDQLRPGDRAAVVTFAKRPRVLVEPTDDRARLHAAIEMMQPESFTRLYDAVDFVLKNTLRRIEGRRAVVLLSDGVDACSTDAGAKSTLRDAEESEALFYTVQFKSRHFGDGRTMPPAPPLNLPGMSGRMKSLPTVESIKREVERRATDYLWDLAEKTGGRYQKAEAIMDVEQAFARIAEELRYQYELGFYPAPAPAQAETRRIKVRVRAPDLAVRARTEYVTGTAAAGAAKGRATR